MTKEELKQIMKWAKDIEAEEELARIKSNVKLNEEMIMHDAYRILHKLRQPSFCLGGDLAEDYAKTITAIEAFLDNRNPKLKIADTDFYGLSDNTTKAKRRLVKFAINELENFCGCSNNEWIGSPSFEFTNVDKEVRKFHTLLKDWMATNPLPFPHNLIDVFTS